MCSYPVITRLLASGVLVGLFVSATMMPARAVNDANRYMEFTIPTADSHPDGTTAGPDGNVWFTEYFGDSIGRITTAGAITEFPIPTAISRPVGITGGPDGNIWFTEFEGNKIG